LIEGHEVTTVPRHGWAGKKNGELLRLTAAEFDAFITIDNNLPDQQNLSQYELAVLVLEAPTNRIEDLRLLVPILLEQLVSLAPSTVLRIRKP